MLRRSARLAFLAAATLVLGAAGSNPALHLRLVKSEPARDATVSESPAAIQLWYNQPPQLRLTKVRLSGPDGSAIELKPVDLVDGDDSHLAAHVPATLQQGAYVVTWRTMARDGHAVSGEFGFRIGAAQ